MEKCPLCGNILSNSDNDPRNPFLYHNNCNACGNYTISKPVIDGLNEPKIKDKRYILSGLIREATENGRHVKLTKDNYIDLLYSTPTPRGPIEAIDRILLFIYNSTKFVSDYVSLTTIDYPIAYAKNTEDFLLYLQYATKLNYLEKLSNSEYRLTLEGWKRIDEIKKVKPISNQAFVAMWFTKKLKSAWVDGFKPALEETGYSPIRIDLLEHNKKIDDQIIAEIRKSSLLVADFTGNRGGVYFEAGFAMGLGIPVIWSCHMDHVKNLHFDTRQYNHITWKNPEELKEKLIHRINATIPYR